MNACFLFSTPAEARTFRREACSSESSGAGEVGVCLLLTAYDSLLAHTSLLIRVVGGENAFLAKKRMG
jgi:hypothetical protein